MLNANQPQLRAASNQLRFTPVSRTFSNIGTTVSYSLIPSTNVNPMDNYGLNSITAQNLNQMHSGQFESNINSNYNFMGQGQLNPIVSASNYNQVLSGSWPHSNTCLAGSRMIQPGIDISETSSDVVVTASVSNLGINNINLNVTENSVTISGTAWAGNESVVLNRTVALPTSIRAESIDANYESGVVEIRCPKAEKFTRQRATISTDPIHQSMHQPMQTK
ncbi:MAG: Hsp20/alpha crystallin family protein [Anaeromicrobium sp.]|jgi:HSP20 family molecular chaperone IbpA|uniref:Hsp20/alpha crystallin family protein n=1 Tax=Anaeromicrobium sp. TaxID=1929132 RepID=UPI0025DF12B0|nr:Hsp20/alpha crystallin family protein [Anaeromicrobium sp.]MCT4594069.1 Hsp20/alpha crystallin family protein [Anaeromicrobium sp.]